MGFKRKQGPLGLERRVRPRREEEWEEKPEDSDSSSGDDDVSEDGITRAEDNEEDDSGEGSGSDSEAESDASEATAPKVDLSAVTFGALARAQASLPPSERKSKTSKSKTTTEGEPTEALPRKSTKSKDDPKPKRSSKHAPQEQSSKRPVSRKREILPDTKRKYRDPRFDTTVGTGWQDEAKTKKAYAFLDEYRDSEMADLRVQIKKTKDPLQKDNLKRQLLSMESKKKARLRKEEEEKLLDEHRKKEKELVAQGKQPFYLKKSEQKKKVLMDRYASMSKGAVDRAIERKRKKVSGKEKKELDWLQRVKPRT
ncbi:Fc.00g052920.m01.CDS01 [Cosmosporella sp. VM-42]